MGLIVDLEEEAVLAADVDVFYFRFLLEGVRVIEGVFEVKNSEDGVPGMMVEDNWRSWKMLILDSPKPDVFLTAADQLIILNWTPLDG